MHAYQVGILNAQESHPSTSLTAEKYSKNSSSRDPVQKRRVFLVDDEPDVVFTIQIVLEENGYAVDCFDKPREALYHFKPFKYDVAILDVRMPEMNGFELYRRLRESDDRIRVCFLTAIRSFSEYGEDLSATYKDEHLVQKPVGNRELLEKIDAILRATTITSTK